MLNLQALEFFSGIGAFRSVAPEFGINVVSAFDQSEDANAVYQQNFGGTVCTRNLDTISGDEIPAADFWWLSPPCQPFSRRGKKADLDDSRAQALVNLLNLLPEKKPRFLAMENVLGFENSRAEAMLLSTLNTSQYFTLKISLSPAQLGIPMQRPRVFYLAALDAPIPIDKPLIDTEAKLRPLADFVDKANDGDSTLRMDDELQAKYADGLNVVSPDEADAKAICFTSGYSRSLKTSGSYISLPDGGLRLFSPQEIAALLGFPSEFKFTDGMSLSCKYRLLGNSIDLRSIRVVLNQLLS